MPPQSSSPPTGAGSGGSGSGSGGSTGVPGAGDLIVTGGNVGPFDLSDLGFGTFGSLDWAIPALALSVPGLLLILAVLAQLAASAVWLPVVRRRLAGTGVGRRRRRTDAPEAVRP